MRDTSTELSMMIGYVLMLDLQWSTMIYNDLQNVTFCRAATATARPSAQKVADSMEVSFA